MNQQGPDWEFEDKEPEVKPLTAQEAQALLGRLPRTSVWRMVLGQAAAGALVAVLAAVLGGADAGWSAAYGALAVVLPAAVFARALTRAAGAAGAGAAMAKLFGWEFVKLVLCIVMLAAAPRVVTNLSWLALLAGMVVTMKTYWVALIFRRPGV